MTATYWYGLLIAAIALIIGGIIGALIQTGISTYRSRKPAIGRRVDVLPKLEECSERSPITISDGQKEYRYEDLHLVGVQITNQSQQDFDELKLGMTLPSGNTTIHIEVGLPERHHSVEQSSPLTFSDPKSEIDLVLRPFNREDTYSFRLLIVTTQVNEDPENIEFSSPQAVHFVDMPTVKEAVKETAKSTTISLGPFSFSFD